MDNIDIDPSLSQSSAYPSYDVSATMTQMSQALTRDSKIFQDVVRDRGCMVYTFFEDQPVATRNGLVQVTQPEGPLLHEQLGILEGNHRSMCKFQTEDDNGYKQVSRAIKAIMNSSGVEYGRSANTGFSGLN